MIRKIIAAVFALSFCVCAAEAQTCATYPNTLTNGQAADANQVMANFNSIRDCVNNKVGREVLTANRTYFVRTDGNDGNNCLANTSGGACLTIQHAIDVVATLDISIYNVTIQVNCASPPCTFTGPVLLAGPWVGMGSVTLRGDTTTPSNVTISVTGSNAIELRNKSTLSLAGFKVTTTTTGHGIAVNTGGVLTVIGKMEFGAVPAVYGHMNVNTLAGC